jgi:pimeloyl-ACP methyl ester carboxylesterase
MAGVICVCLVIGARAARAGDEAPASAAAQSLLVKLPSGITLNYLVQGDPHGRVIVLLHGLGDSWHSFDLVTSRLPAKYRVYAITQRGHGWSDHPAEGYARTDFAGDIEAFLEQMNLRNVVLVGHSMGSFVAQQVASDDAGHSHENAPTRVAKLVLIGSGPGSVPDPNKPNEFAAELEQLQDPIPYTFARDFQASTIYSRVPPAFFETLVSEAMKAPASMWHGIGKNFVGPVALEKVKIPTLIFWGDKDLFFKRADEDALVSKIAGSKLMVYADTGHALHWERPERFTRDLVEFEEK